MICKYFLSYCRLPFHFLDSEGHFLCPLHKAFNSDSVIYVFVVVAYIFGIIFKCHSQIKGHVNVPLCFLLTVYSFNSYIYVFDSFWVSLCVWGSGPTPSFTCGYPVVSAPFVKEVCVFMQVSVSAFSLLWNESDKNTCLT